MNTNMFSRQISLLGLDNQKKIESCSVGILGLGGLGSVVAHLLARMGVKRFVFVDDDIVSLSNLSRQHLFTQNDLDKEKVLAAREHVLSILPDCSVTCVKKRVSSRNDFFVFDDVDIIVDGLDNHATRRLLDMYCKEKGKPWVHGSAVQEKGSVFFFDATVKYDSVYPSGAIDSHCEFLGVLATTTTLIATLQSQLVIQFLLGRDIPCEFFHIDLSSLSVNKYLKK